MRKQETIQVKNSVDMKDDERDWVQDPVYPPATSPLHFFNEGSVVHGAIYVAQGAGPNPCLIMTPEVGGYERLTSLFVPLCMAGISVAYFYPRGMWDTRETYTLDGALSDLKQMVAYLKSPAVTAKFRIDTDRIVLGGMSGGGGTLSLIAAAEDPTLRYVMAVTPYNFSAERTMTEVPGAREMTEDSYRRMDMNMDIPEAVRKRLSIIPRASEFVGKTLLILNGSQDTFNPVEVGHKPIVDALRSAGVAKLTDVILDSGHSLLTRRPELERLVKAWLRDECGFRC